MTRALPMNSSADGPVEIVFCASQIYFQHMWLRKPTRLLNQWKLFSNTLFLGFLSLLLPFLTVSQSFSSSTKLLYFIVTSTLTSSFIFVSWVTIHVNCTHTTITIHVFMFKWVCWLTCELHNVSQQHTQKKLEENKNSSAKRVRQENWCL